MKLTLAKIGWLACLAALTVVSISAINLKKEGTIDDASIQIEEFDEGEYFLTESDVRAELETMIALDSQDVISQVHIDEIEEVLLNNPFIDDVDVYITADGQLGVKVDQKQPVLRVIDRDGNNYYLDRTGGVVPTSPYFTARVPVATGYVDLGTWDEESGRNIKLDQLMEFINTISNDKFMKPLVEQIDFDAEGSVTLVPKVGKAPIVFGDLQNVDEKIETLKAFYEQVLVEGGWSMYKSINLSYDGQVVCKKTDS